MNKKILILKEIKRWNICKVNKILLNFKSFKTIMDLRFDYFKSAKKIIFILSSISC